MESVECNDDYYLILEIPNTATLEVVTKNYRRLAKVRHPDRNLGTAKSTAEFQRVSPIPLNSGRCKGRQRLNQTGEASKSLRHNKRS